MARWPSRLALVALLSSPAHGLHVAPARPAGRVRCRALRCAAEPPEPRPDAIRPGPEAQRVNDDLLADIRAFKGESGGGLGGDERSARRREIERDLGIAPSRPGSAGQEEGALYKTIDTLGTVLTYNFFIICSFFLWFLTGVVAQFGAGNVAIMNSFRAAWDVLIQPLLGTHMLLTFISYGLEKVAAADEPA